MIRTLERYLGKDLARATALATVAFTLVMTVIAVIEPLRKQGLSGAQALSLFGYFLPLMCSLTLPVAALFAATIIYGRFSQDNELMACRASGVCTLTLMRPALVLGAIVGGSALLLGLHVAPTLWTMAERTVKHNLRQITYHQLKTRGHVNITRQRRLFHADHVDMEGGRVAGVVLIDYKHEGNARCLVASEAGLDFPELDGRTCLEFDFQDTEVCLQRRGSRIGFSEQDFRYLQLPGMPKDQPRLYGWKQLWDTWRDVNSNPAVQEEKEKILDNLLQGLICRELTGAIEREGRYDGFVKVGTPENPEERVQLEVEATEARLHGPNAAELGPAVPASGPASSPAASAPASAPAGRTVVVRERIGGELHRELRARSGRLECVRPDWRRELVVSLSLTDVEVRTVWAGGRTHRDDTATIGDLKFPEELRKRSREIDLDDLAAHPEKYNASKEVRTDVEKLRGRFVQRLRSKVRAEIHLRLSYGISTFLMVLIGAALGLLWRGGQMLAAFAISAVPGSAVVVMLLMGREFIRNPHVADAAGTAVIWGGIGLLAAAAAYLYLVVLRR